MGERDKTVSVTEFKTHCLSMMDDVNTRKITRLKVQKRGKLHVEIVAPSRVGRKKRTAFGSLKGWVIIPEGFDIMKPVFEGEIDAEKGILHR